MDADPVSAALLPAILRRVRRATGTLEDLAEAAPEHEGVEGLESPLEALGAEGCALGWVLAVLGSAAGQELLLARRERRGIEFLAALLGDALRDGGRSLGPHPGPVPDLHPEVGEGWEQPWALARLVLAAAEALRPGETLAWRVRAEGADLHLKLSAPPDAGAIAQAASVLPGLGRDEDGELRLPGG